MFSLIFADQVAVNLTNPRITIGRIQPEAMHVRQRNVRMSGKLVPEARLELARLAAEDFESPASTIPPHRHSPASIPERDAQAALSVVNMAASRTNHSPLSGWNLVQQAISAW